LVLNRVTGISLWSLNRHDATVVSLEFLNGFISLVIEGLFSF
jgi:hypothetical protein